MARCGCGSSCTCTVDVGQGLGITGTGDEGFPYVVSIDIDPASPSEITVGVDGLSVAATGDVATDTLWDAKGDLVAGTGADAADILTVGANGEVLIADSAEPTGVKWGAVSGTGITDTDKGDIVVSGSGSVWTIDADAVTYAKMQDVTATDKVLGRSTAGSGIVEEIAFTSQARQLADDTSFADMRTTLSAEYTGNKGAVNGYAELDASAKVPIAQVQDEVMVFQGDWDADTNTPTLVDGIGGNSDVYVVTDAGTQDLGSGSITYTVGDYIIYTGTVWQKLSDNSLVTSVFTRTGDVVATAGDYTAAQVTNTPAGNIAAVTVQTALNELDTEKQPVDATLTALAAYSTNGILTQTASDTFAGRTISSGDAAQITVTNGDGVAGNPTISFPASGFIEVINGIKDGNGNELFAFGSTASAVNQVAINNAATGGSPSIFVSGGDTNISLSLDAQGTGVIKAEQALVSTPATLTDAATIATDASLSNHFRVVLGGNRILGNPTNPTDGQKVVWEIIQDNTGSRTLSYGGQFTFGTDITSATLTTTPNKRDFIGAVYNSSEAKWYIVSVSRGY